MCLDWTGVCFMQVKLTRISYILTIKFGLYIDSSSVARGLRYFSTQES